MQLEEADGTSCHVTSQTAGGVSEQAAAAGLPPAPPWPGQEGCGSGSFGGSGRLLRADSAPPTGAKRGESVRTT